MSSEILYAVYDKDGNAYSMTFSEASEAINSGAYFPEHTGFLVGEKSVKNGPIDPGLVAIFDVKTNEKLYRQPIDARELVASGFYSFVDADIVLEVEKQAENLQAVPEQKQETIEVKQSAKTETSQETVQPEELPELTMKNSKEEITAELRKYAVPFRSNMDKDDLLQAWTDFVAEQAQE